MKSLRQHVGEGWACGQAHRDYRRIHFEVPGINRGDDDDHDACDVINEDDDKAGGDRDEDIDEDAERGRGGGKRKEDGPPSSRPPTVGGRGGARWTIVETKTTDATNAATEPYAPPHSRSSASSRILARRG